MSLLRNWRYRYIYNDRREKIFEGFIKLLKDLREINCSHVYVDGSFVTSKPHPNDIDVCWHLEEDPPERQKQLQLLKEKHPILFYLQDPRSRMQIQQQYYADVFPANITEGASGLRFKDFFQKEKISGEQKGIIVIHLI